MGNALADWQTNVSAFVSALSRAILTQSVGGIMASLQVRSIDKQLYEALRVKARMDNRSISQEVVAMLKDCLSRPSNRQGDVTDYLLQLCGTWQDDRDEREIAEDLRASRLESTGRFEGDF